MEAQHSLDWYRKRLGVFTGSSVEKLLKAPKKGAEFSETALSYIYSKVAERTMNPRVVESDDLLAMHLKQVEITNKAIRWGNEQEESARQLYSEIKGVWVEEQGLCVHPEIKYFGSSPDGVVISKDGEIVGCIEIKCPEQIAYVRYSLCLDNEDLKTAKPEYYYQCQSHMMVLDVEWCDFIAYSPWQSDPIHIVRIARDPEACELIMERVKVANDKAEQIIECLQCQ